MESNLTEAPALLSQIQDGDVRTKVIFTYSRSGSDPKLKYQCVNGNESAIDGKDIIGVFPTPRQRLTHKVVFVVNPEKQGDHPDIKSITAIGLPIDFLQDYESTFPVGIDSEGPPHDIFIHIIISTLSGTGKAKDFYNRAIKPVLSYLPLQENQYILHYTQSEKSVTELTAHTILPRANEGTRQRIIILSGDGGIVDIINSLLSAPHRGKYRPPELTILPLGTGNALAHSIGITNDNTFGLASLIRGHAKPLPLFKASFSPGARLLVDEANSEEELATDPDSGKPTLYGAVVCSWGMHAGLVGDSDTTEYRKHGAERFRMAAKEALFPADGSAPHTYKAKVSVLKKDAASNEESWAPIPRNEHMYVLATLVSNLEKSFTISPASKPLGGQLRLVHFGPMAGEEVMRVMGLAYQAGQHVNDPAVGYEDIEGLCVEFEGREEDARWRRICIDGKIIRVEKDGWVEVRKEERPVIDVVFLV
ncbi:hypothetical protein K432DRAFT_387277 [Lepidopterella palustris CBS 459.81]|uniref:DAGKc domain-containing protein n=1 Tax=Lepidopterella palustris CBS 459.81 TaxID=1314670 RepID=A0A8E2J9F4_9PEZI|nr:hypothetical protein K432DRAFT_387277 [Lepidopterella palustris CBS 459.81]